MKKVCKDGAWVDSSYDPNPRLVAVELKFGSEALLAAIEADPQPAVYGRSARTSP